MHETMNPRVIGHIDEFFVADNNLKISGWLVSEDPRDEVVFYIDGGSPIAFFNYNERQDVAAAYSSTDPRFTHCGFDLSIPVPQNNIVSIYALVKNQRELIYEIDMQASRQENIQQPLANEHTEIVIRNSIVPELIVVDNFYTNPDAVRELALQQNFEPDLRYFKGNRTSTRFLAPGTKQVFESLIGRRITNWVEHGFNGVFQYCTAEDPLVYHSDVQSYAAAIYLTPNAPIETGTSFFRSKEFPDVRSTSNDNPEFQAVFKGGFYDKTKFEEVDSVGNVYNRLVIWNSKLIHSASGYFGTNKFDSRLFHLFFFDIEE